MDNKNLRFGASIIINLLIVAAAVMLIYSIGMWGFKFGSSIFNETSVDTAERAREVEVTLPVNITDSKLADIMYEKGLIEDKLVFRIQIMLSDYKGNFKAGTYTLNTAMKPTQIMQELSKANQDDEETQ